ncbi:MAG: hypothetical protein HYW25_00390 [Candidatus Aenigmarchaeota archaeon]|nr:hypothetical protein [Candidatus Aenigmarchaeota archaeon]
MCGICLVYNVQNASEIVKAGLLAQEHRGQNGVGIGVPHGMEFLVRKTDGMASDAIKRGVFDGVDGSRHAVGHVRYPTFGGRKKEALEKSAQPEVYYGSCAILLAHNGNINNCKIIGREMEEKEIKVNEESQCDARYLLGALACELNGNEEPTDDDIFAAVERVQQKVEGAYSATALIATRSGRMIGLAFKDPYGIRPMVIGTNESGFMIASETTALDFVGFDYSFEPEPGEAVVFDENGAHRKTLVQKGNSPCIFEYIYFASPDSVMYGVSVGGFRYDLGYDLARREDCEYDILIPIQNSGLHHSDGYVKGMWDHHKKHVDVVHALVKRGGRVFIDPDPDRTEKVIRKHSPIRRFIHEKRVATADDSTVRGDTAKALSGILYSAGAREVHQRASAGIKSPCYYGIDTPDPRKLAIYMIQQEIRKEHPLWDKDRIHAETERRFAERIDSTSFRYNPPDVIVSIMRRAGIPTPDAACLTGEYPTPDGRRLLQIAQTFDGGGKRVYDV